MLPGKELIFREPTLGGLKKYERLRGSIMGGRSFAFRSGTCIPICRVTPVNEPTSTMWLPPMKKFGVAGGMTIVESMEIRRSPDLIPPTAAGPSSTTSSNIHRLPQEVSTARKLALIEYGA